MVLGISVSRETRGLSVGGVRMLPVFKLAPDPELCILSFETCSFLGRKERGTTRVLWGAVAFGRWRPGSLSVPFRGGG